MFFCTIHVAFNQVSVNMSSQDGSQDEEVKSRLSPEPEMCPEDRAFFEWADICECPRPVTMDECACQAYKAHLVREQQAPGEHK
jgi:hypothetical protein